MIVDQQLRYNDCGISAVKTICNLLEVDISRKSISEGIPLDAEGATLGSMARFLNEIGLSTQYKLMDFNSLKGKNEEIKDWFPCIISVKKDRSLHYIVLEGLRNGKFVVLDPLETQKYELSVQELKKIAYVSSTMLNFIELDAKIRFVIDSELSKHGIRLDVEDLNKQDALDIFNKLAYFSYVDENYGFKDDAIAREFLEDLIFVQELDVIPKHFRSVNLSGESKIEIKAPLVLLAKKIEGKVPGIVGEPDENVYLRLIKSVKGIRELWMVFFVTSVIASIITYLAVFINQILLDHILPSYQINTLILFAIGVGVFEVFDMALGIYKRFIYIHLGNTFDKYFLSVFDARLNNQSIRFLQSFKRGDLTERLSDSLKIKSFFMRLFSKVFINLMVAIMSIGILMAINLKLSLIVFIVLILFSIIYRIVTPMYRKLEQQRYIVKADLFSKFIEKIDGLQVIKSLQLESYSTREISKRVNRMIAVSTRARYLDLANSTASGLITLVFSLLILVYLSREMMLYNSISLGQIITFTALSGKIFRAFERLLDANISIQEHRVILNRFFDFEEKKEISSNDKDQSSLIQDFDLDKMELSNINFSYIPEVNVLNDLNFCVEKGDKIWIQGKNGSGKSTLCKILNFLFQPAKGSVRINGIDSSMYLPEAVMRKVVMVSNDDIIFNDTLLFNITFGKRVDLPQLVQYAHQLDIYDFIESKAEKFDFVVHENGKNLSTGQRKKLLLLRALVSEAEIIILDEIFFGMDIESKKQAEEMINDMNDKAFIIISHEGVTEISFHKNYQLVNGALFDI